MSAEGQIRPLAEKIKDFFITMLLNKTIHTWSGEVEKFVS